MNDIYSGSSTHAKVVFSEVLYPIELEFENGDFLGEWKPENPEKNFSERNKVNSHMATRTKSNPDLIGGRRVQFLLCHPAPCHFLIILVAVRHTMIVVSTQCFTVTPLPPPVPEYLIYTCIINHVRCRY